MKKLFISIILVILTVSNGNAYTDADKVFTEDDKLCSLFVAIGMLVDTNWEKSEYITTAKMKRIYQGSNVFENGTMIHLAIKKYIEHYHGGNAFLHMKIERNHLLTVGFMLKEFSENKSVGLEIYKGSSGHSISVFSCEKTLRGCLITYADSEDGVDQLLKAEFVFDGYKWRCISPELYGFIISGAVSLTKI